ncbi:MAG: GlsB/YeaQ/YmgE family stress response membrane protein [Chloroflexota bacterium]|nr:GlsB/YeaQ/YmgE family stress response membrane protein [Chloroflexota bacterium]
MGIVSWLVVGAIAGYLAGMFVKGDERLGVIGHIFLGIVGALIGGFIANQITKGDYLTGINITTIVVAAIGAVIAVVAYKALTGRRAV